MHFVRQEKERAVTQTAATVLDFDGHRFVVLSVLIAIFAPNVFLDLALRVTAASGGVRWVPYKVWSRALQGSSYSERERDRWRCPI